MNISHAKQGTDSAEPNKQNATISPEQTKQMNITNKRNYNRHMRKIQNAKDDSSLH